MRDKTVDGPGAALIYCRVSTARQAEEGTSLDSQEAACVTHAQDLGYTIGRITREVYSGAELWDRPLLGRDRADLKMGQFQALIAYATDRLSRDPVHLAIIAEECARQDVQLLFVTEPLDTSPEGQLIQYVKGFAAHVEREKIRERQLRGKRTRALTGRIHNYGPDLYGYRRDKTAGVRTVYEPEASVVRDIFRWTADEHLPLRAVARRLNERGVLPPSVGKITYSDPDRRPRWGKNQLHRLLHNPAYKGETMAWRWQRTGKGPYVVPRAPEEQIRLPDGVTPALVPPDMWERAQVALTTQHGDDVRNATRPYLLRGFIWCAHCGQRMNSNTENARTTHPMRVYRCSSRDKAGGACGAKRTQADAVEVWAWGHVADVLRNPETVAAELRRRQERGPDTTLTADLETARRELAKRERQQEKVLQVFSSAEEGIPADLIKRELVRLEREKEQFAATIADIERRIAQQELAVEHLASLSAYCARVAYNLETFGFDERRLALEALNVRVSVNGREWSLTGAIPLEVSTGAEVVASSNIRMLCPPLAATSSARFTCSCPRTSERSKG